MISQRGRFSEVKGVEEVEALPSSFARTVIEIFVSVGERMISRTSS